jgi:hypothetical protein
MLIFLWVKNKLYSWKIKKGYLASFVPDLKNEKKKTNIRFNKQSTTQVHQIHGPHFFFPFRYGT